MHYLQIAIFLAALLIAAFPYHCIYGRQKSWTERFNRTVRGWKISNFAIKEYSVLTVPHDLGGFPVPDEFTKLIQGDAVLHGEPMVIIDGEFGVQFEYRSVYEKRIRMESPVKFLAADGSVLKQIQYKEFLGLVGQSVPI